MHHSATVYITVTIDKVTRHDESWFSALFYPPPEVSAEISLHLRLTRLEVCIAAPSTLKKSVRWSREVLTTVELAAVLHLLINLNHLRLRGLSNSLNAQQQLGKKLSKLSWLQSFHVDDSRGHAYALCAFPSTSITRLATLRQLTLSLAWDEVVACPRDGRIVQDGEECAVQAVFAVPDSVRLESVDLTFSEEFPFPYLFHLLLALTKNADTIKLDLVEPPSFSSSDTPADPFTLAALA